MTTERSLTSVEFGSLTSQEKEARKAQSWTFPPAPQYNDQHPTHSIKSHGSGADGLRMDSLPLRQSRSHDKVVEDLDEDGLLRARHDGSHRVLNASQTWCTDSQIPAHISTGTPRFLGQATHHTGSTDGVGRPESFSPTMLDQKPFARQPKYISATPRSHSVGKQRKSLSERLQEESMKQSASDAIPSLTNQTQTSYHVPTSASLFPASIEPIDKAMETRDNFDLVLGSKFNLSSRSNSVSSITPDTKGMQNMVMEAMKSMQRYEAEVETQKTEIEKLNNQILLLREENEKLNSKVRLVKDNSLQRLSISSQKLEALRIDLASMKSASQTLTSVSTDEVRQLKKTISALSTKYIENQRYDSPDGAGKTREVINELNADRMNKQQVLDMLQDRLNDAISELAASKHRVFELEDAYAVDKLAWKHVNEQLAAMGSQVTELASSLKKERNESIEAMTLAGDLEAQLQSSKSEVSYLSQLVDELKAEATNAACQETHISDLQSLISRQKEELSCLDDIRKENTQLKSAVKETEARVKALHGDLSQLDAIEERNGSLESRLKEVESERATAVTELSKVVNMKDSEVLNNTQLKRQLLEAESKAKSLESELVTKSQFLDELRTLAENTQAALDISCQSVKTLGQELASSRAMEAASRAAEASEKAQRIEETRVKTLNAHHLALVERKHESLLVEVAEYKEQAQEARTRCQSLQERFEEQSITLRLTRDTSAELQDRLIAAEANYATNLEAKCGCLRTQVAILQEQNTALQKQLELCKLGAEETCKEFKARESDLFQRIKTLERKQSDLLTDIATLQEQYSSCQIKFKENSLESQAQHAAFSKREQDLLQQIDGTRKELEREVHNSRNIKTQSERELAEALRRYNDLDSRVAAAQEQDQATPASCIIHKASIENLTAQVSRISSECATMRERARTLTKRYDQGDLDPEERLLIKKVMDATQTTHDHELAQVQNELNRCIKLIDTLQNAKITLENSLAKHLAAGVSRQVNTPVSAIEFMNWISSQPDVSMEDCVPPAQDKDEPSTAPDDPPGRENAALSSPLTPIQSERPLVIYSTPATINSNKNFGPLSMGKNKVTFSSLAADKSDEIGEVDEILSSKRKKVQSGKTGAGEVLKSAKRARVRNDQGQANVEQRGKKEAMTQKRKKKK